MPSVSGEVEAQASKHITPEDQEMLNIL